MQWGAQKNHVTICMFKKLMWLKGLTRRVTRVNSSPTPKTANRCGGGSNFQVTVMNISSWLKSDRKKNGHDGPEKWTLYGKSKKAGRDLGGILPLKNELTFHKLFSDWWNSVLFMKEISQAKAHFVKDLLGSWEILGAYPPKKTNLEPFDIHLIAGILPKIIEAIWCWLERCRPWSNDRILKKKSSSLSSWEKNWQTNPLGNL